MNRVVLIAAWAGTWYLLGAVVYQCSRKFRNLYHWLRARVVK